MSNSNFNRFAEFPRNHQDITSLTSNTVDLPRQMLIMAGSDGTIAAQDSNGTAITYTVTAGAILPIVTKRVLVTGTTVTQIIGLY